MEPIDQKPAEQQITIQLNQIPIPTLLVNVLNHQQSNPQLEPRYLF